MLRGHGKTVNSVVFSTDGKLALSGSTDTTLRLGDAATGQLLRTLQRKRNYDTYYVQLGHTAQVNAVALSEMAPWRCPATQTAK